MKVIINECFGGFGLSDAAYERLIELGIPVRPYIEQKRNPETGLYEKVPENEGRIIFDRTLTPAQKLCDARSIEFMGRYWTAVDDDQLRVDPLVIQVVEELGAKANGACAKLRVIEIPDGIEWNVDEYDGYEHIAEAHRTWR